VKLSRINETTTLRSRQPFAWACLMNSHFHHSLVLAGHASRRPADWTCADRGIGGLFSLVGFSSLPSLILSLEASLEKHPNFFIRTWQSSNVEYKWQDNSFQQQSRSVSLYTFWTASQPHQPTKMPQTAGPDGEYWLPGYQLSRHIVLRQLQYFLGPSATVRPYSLHV